MGTPGEFRIHDGGYGHSVSVTHDGYVDGFGVDVLRYIKRTLYDGESFSKTIFSFAMEMGTTVDPASVYPEWEYVLDLDDEYFQVRGYSSHEGEPLIVRWLLAKLPTEKEMIAPFNDEPQELASQEW